MKRLVFLAISTVFLIGCENQIKDYVRGVPKKTPPPRAPDTMLTDYPTLKFSPGAGQALGNKVSAQYAITPTARVAAGTHVKSKFSFHAKRLK